MLTAYLVGLEAHLAPAFVIFFSAVLQSITGFGLVIVAAPLLMIFYDPKLTVPIMLLLACCANFCQGLFALRTANLRLVFWLYLGVLCGQPLGFWAFDHASSAMLKVFISAIVLFSLGTMQAFHLRIRERPRNSWITGIFSGFTSITAGMGGPPFLIYLAHSRMTVEVMRATCFVFFFLCNVTSLTSYELGGLPIAPAHRPRHLRLRAQGAHPPADLCPALHHLPLHDPLGTCTLNTFLSSENLIYIVKYYDIIDFVFVRPRRTNIIYRTRSG